MEPEEAKGLVLSAMQANDVEQALRLGRRHALEQSPNWHLRSTLVAPTRIDGFPYSEGTPHFNGNYVIVLVDGRRLDATVDRSRQYAAEGSHWTTREGHIDRHQVACWISKKLL